MPNEIDDVVQNIKQPSVWIRVLFMVLFYLVIWFVLVLVIGVVALAQALFAIISGEPNRNLCRFGNAMSQYTSQILAFLTFNSDSKPFPFADFPLLDPAPEEVAGTSPAGAESASQREEKAGSGKASPKKAAHRKSRPPRSTTRNTAASTNTVSAAKVNQDKQGNQDKQERQDKQHKQGIAEDREDQQGKGKNTTRDGSAE